MKLNEFIQQNGKVVSTLKNEYVFTQGEQQKDVYIVTSGLLKAFYISEKGREIIKSFLLPGDIIGGTPSIFNKEETSFHLQCIKNSTLLKIPIETLQQAIKKSHDISLGIIEHLLTRCIKKERREYELLFLSAQERYIEMMKNTPQVINQVTQNDIAHYLGITPVALSRIKKRINSH